MTREEARKEMQQGKKVAHEFFMDNEYLFMVDNVVIDIILTEDGFNFTEQFNTIEHFKTGWQIYE